MAYISESCSTCHRTARRTGLLGYLDLYRQRRALLSLDDARLEDLGLSREAVKNEANRPIWDAPAYWSH
ncbi:MAG: DUF1127 domain-containing protein [Litoreibacter sp.]|nr:DUF1127 domain-containing protein [Litoreibacter sp.]